MESAITSSMEGCTASQCKSMMITVDYYEMMKFTHWNPKFHQLASKLAGLLLRNQHSRTNIQSDAWPLAQLVHLQSDLLDPFDLSASNSVAHHLLAAIGIDPSVFRTANSSGGVTSARNQKPNEIMTTIVQQLVQPLRRTDQITHMPDQTDLVNPLSGLSKLFIEGNPQVTILPSVSIATLCPPLYTPSHQMLMLDHSRNMMLGPKSSRVVTFNEQINNLAPSLYSNRFCCENALQFIVSSFHHDLLNPIKNISGTNSFSHVAIHSRPTMVNEKMGCMLPPDLTDIQAFRSILINPQSSSLAELRHTFLPNPLVGALNHLHVARSPPALLTTPVTPSLIHPVFQPNTDAEIQSCLLLGSTPLTTWRLPGSMYIPISNHLGPRISTCRLEVLLTRDEAKTRFMCSTCGRQWTSMKGSITFVVILSHSTTGAMQSLQWIIQPGANVFFELFPQSCSACDVLCQPKWYPEEIDKVIRNLFVRIHDQFYQGVIPWDDQWNWHRRDGQPSGPHNSNKCVACHNGLCRGGLKNHMNQDNSSGHETMDRTKKTTPEVAVLNSTAVNKDSTDCVSGASSPNGPPSSKRRSTIIERQ
ncbi:receptor-transporting protein 3 [Clonorchis sinensis]|uniref:Receptor-transporting protein 3 n=1 Tax=Clonorchis sinensis TaxID=79923 RepID=H2KQV3_CLOSI|nr:receptor-transporting protein 3 [Clonorchis sinensis]